MICEVIELGEGQRVIVCGRKVKAAPPACRFCGAHSSRLCDFPVLRPVISGGMQSMKKGTCDAPCCEKCATNVGLDSDLCPVHKKEWTGTAGKP